MEFNIRKSNFEKKMEEEFSLSDKGRPHPDFIYLIYMEKDLKEFIKRREKENKDFEEDIIALIEINNYSKKDLIVKIKKLCKVHKEEREKLLGDKLI